MIHLLKYVDLTLHAELIQFTKSNLEANLEEIHQEIATIDTEVRMHYALRSDDYITEEYIQREIFHAKHELEIEAFRLVHAIATLN